MRNATLAEVGADGTVRPLEPLVPQGMGAEFTWQSDATSGSRHAVWTLSDGASQPTIAVPEAARVPGSRWTLTLRPAPGTAFAVGNVSWSGAAPNPVRPSLRPGLLAGHANTLGHGAAIAAVTGMTLAATASWPFLGSAAGGAAVVLLTGGRAATAAFLVGALVLLALRSLQAKRPGLAWASFAAVAGAGVALFLARDALPFNVGGLGERVAIWRGAWDAFLAHPWTGLVGGGHTFLEGWDRFGTTGERVTHAHHQLLDLLARYGVLGGAAGLAWFVASGAVLLRRRHAQRLAVLASLLVVTTFDTTLLSAFVLFPWVMLLVAREDGEDGS
ncbi:MAG: O-antigen ligase family protein [Trueperaceae bacterium]|nr:O-antigen ligase family protein [Trueperaceae bacterium]